MRTLFLRSRSGAFTLVEMLTVLSILALLTALAAPSMSSLFRSNRLDQNIETLSGVLERARQAALSDNSYVWVAFTANPATTAPAQGVSVVVLESQDGTDALNNFSTTSLVIGAANSNLRVLSTVQNLPGINITNAGVITASAIPSLPAATPSAASIQGSSGTPMSLTLNYGNLPYTFTRAIEYAPDGEAKIATLNNSWSNQIEFGMESSIATTSPDVSVMRVSTLTGRLTVYRP